MNELREILGSQFREYSYRNNDGSREAYFDEIGFGYYMDNVVPEIVELFNKLQGEQKEEG
jgi:hypothetical protein